jgi:hypothetical protein
MATFAHLNGETGNRSFIAYGSENGDVSVAGTFHGYGSATFHGNLTILGDLILSDTTVIDILTTTVYHFADPVIELNTSFTGLFIAGSGFDIYRGLGFDHAILEFIEDPTRTNNYWRTGLGVDLLRVGRVADAMSNLHALYWDDVAFALATHASITFNPTYATFGVPIQEDIAIAGLNTIIKYNESNRPYLNLDYYLAGVLQDSLQFGNTAPYTYGVRAFTDIMSMTDTRGMLFRAITPTYADTRYIFDGVCALGVDASSEPQIYSSTQLHINGTSHTYIGTTGAVPPQIDVTPGLVTINTDVTASAIHFTIRSLTTEQINFNMHAGVNPFPLGWGGSETQNAVIATSTTNLVQHTTEYEVTLAYTFPVLAPADENTQVSFIIPIYIGSDQTSIRALSGMSQRLAPAPLRTFGIPSGDLYIQSPYALGTLVPPLTNGYFYLTLNVVQRSSEQWYHVITVRTRLPELV